MMMFLVVLLAIMGMARAGCDNQCSGHGTCGLNGVCTCFDNWGLGMSHDSGDCSERICPFEFSWVDTPDEVGAHHKYTECASKGICDRESGQCECFAGYEGKACQRTSCPNDCSGHGQCEYIENLGFKHGTWDYHAAATSNGYVADPTSSFMSSDVTLPYRYWDKTKTRGCVCDPEWADVDCSKRMCPYGNDVMDHRQDMNNAQEYHVQIIDFVTETGVDIDEDATNEIADRTFALTFTSKLNETFTTIPIVFKGYVNSGDDPKSDQYNAFTAAIESALEGLPNEVIDEVKVTMTAPAALDDGEKVSVNVTFTGAHVQGTQNLLKVQVHSCGDGCTPKLDGLTLAFDHHMVKEAPVAETASATVAIHHPADFNSYECGRRGKCDYDSGVCECFEGYTGIACNTITALV